MSRLSSFILLLALGCSAASKSPNVSPAQSTATPAGISITQQTNDRYVEQVKRTIDPRLDEPAEQVFKNIQILKGVPARQFLAIMNIGYSRALGVTCTHCHVEQDFSSDDKRPKRAAREMAAMHRMINEKLRSMDNLPDDAKTRAINCNTCHRGAIDPRSPGH